GDQHARKRSDVLVGCLGLVIALAIFPPILYELFWISGPAIGVCASGIFVIHRLDRPRRQREEARRASVADMTAVLLREGLVTFEAEQLEYLRFYGTEEWRHVRAAVIRRDGRTCRVCSAVILFGRDLTVDHILPRSRYPHLALDRTNLRVLCRRCNS